LGLTANWPNREIAVLANAAAIAEPVSSSRNADNRQAKHEWLE
jgi:hypothetical protein